MAIKTIEEYIQNDNEDRLNYNSASEWINDQQAFMDISISESLDLLEEIDPNCFSGRRSAIEYAITNQTIEFNSSEQTVTKTKIWENRSDYDIFASLPWDSVNGYYDKSLAKLNYTKEITIVEI